MGEQPKRRRLRIEHDEILFPESVVDAKDAEIAALKADLDRLRGGPPFLYDDCSDCGRPLVRIDGPDVWVCPACCHTRMRKAEARADGLEHHKTSLTARLRETKAALGEARGRIIDRA